MSRAWEVARRVVVWSLAATAIALAIVMIVAQNQFWVFFGWTGFTVVGAVILDVRRGNAIGRLLLGIGIYWPLFGVLGYLEIFAYVPEVVEILASWIGYIVWIAVALIVVIFPSGRVSSRFGRIIVGVLVGLMGVLLVASILDPSALEISGRPNPFGVVELGTAIETFLDGPGSLTVPVICLASLVDLVLRWRRSTGVERLQFRWLAFGTAVTIVAITGSFLEILPTPASAILLIGLNAIPVAIGIAVTRYGLYEIGRVVSHTVTYAIVTALAIGVYALIVTSATLLLPGAPAVGVALATFAAAALFLPLLRWVQRWVDRRFDRERYVTDKVVDAFGERLRTGADPATTAPALVAAVEQTLQPASLGLWTSGARP